MRKLVLSSVVTLLLLTSCGQKDNSSNEKAVGVKKTLAVETTKKIEEKPKVAQKTREERIFPHKDIDREANPIAGIWDAGSANDGVFVFQPDGTFQFYGQFDKECKDEPKVKGKYTFTNGNELELSFNDKTEKHVIEKVSGFVSIGDWGLFFPPESAKIKKKDRSIKDPAKLIDFCNKITESNVSNVYPYLSKKSKMVLKSVGIKSKTELARHDDYTGSLKRAISDFREITDLKEIKKDDKETVYSVSFKNSKKQIEKENVTLVNEDGVLKCTRFDNEVFVMKTKTLKDNFKLFENLPKVDPKNKKGPKMPTLLIKEDQAPYSNESRVFISESGEIKISLTGDKKYSVEGRLQLQYNTASEAFFVLKPRKGDLLLVHFEKSVDKNGIIMRVDDNEVILDFIY
ncbi:hypothetical protein JXR93_06970 [bacterium]|nr:hypothetical protein [bacterium]